jgi:flagellar biosynthesis protein FliQ
VTVGSRTARVAIATAVALVLSLGAGLVVALLFAGTPVSDRLAAFCCTAAPVLMLCVITGGPLLDWADRRRVRRARR